MAVKSGNVADVEALFNEAASPKHGMDDVANYVAPNGFPFLHWAALNDHTGLIDFLVDRGANVRQRNSRGEEALCWAALKGHRQATARLLRHGASEDAADDRGYTVRATPAVSVVADAVAVAVVVVVVVVLLLLLPLLLLVVRVL